MIWSLAIFSSNCLYSSLEYVMKRLVSESYILFMISVFDYFSCCFLTSSQCFSSLAYNVSGRTRLVSSNLLSLLFKLSNLTASINCSLLLFLGFCALTSTIFSKILKMILSRRMISKGVSFTIRLLMPMPQAVLLRMAWLLRKRELPSAPKTLTFLPYRISSF
jgi:hypothetical protein